MVDNKNNFIGKVKLDFSAYDGKDTYSDGNVEAEILANVQADNEENFLRNDNRFPVLYHLSPLRDLLVEWLPIAEGESVLEIGCGCGAITRCLLRGNNSVDAVEISPRRAQICALRNRDKENLTIHVGNLNAMTFDKKFDKVFLIGVLEYAASFTHTKNPQVDFINKCKSFLKPNGALIIAIENRVGLEYWSGKPEDHTGKIFDGIMNYPEPKGIKTFSRSELKGLLDTCGLTRQKFFYPFPDYKFPYIIHSDDMLPINSELLHFNDSFYDTNRAALFPMEIALPSIVNAGLYRELSNSFLIIAGQTDDALKNLPLKISANNCPRKPKYSLRTEICAAPISSGLIVRKFARTPSARRHLKTMVENSEIFSKAYSAQHVAQMKLVTEDMAEMEFIDGESFEDFACRVLLEGGVDEFIKTMEFFCQNILRGTNDKINFLDDVIDFNLPNRAYELDLNFSNVIIRDGNFVLIDYEFLLPILPKRFVAYRALTNLDYNCGFLLQKYGISLDGLLAAINVNDTTRREYNQQENALMKNIEDSYYIKYRKKRLPVTRFETAS